MSSARMCDEWRAGVMEHATGMHVIICIYMCCVGGYRQKCSVVIYVVRPGSIYSTIECDFQRVMHGGVHMC